MFSTRLNWDAPPNRLLQTLAAKRAAGAELFDLTESNPTHAGFTYDTGDLLRVLAQPAVAAYEPSPIGWAGARQAIARYYQDWGQPVDPDSVCLTASTSEAYSFIFRLLGDAGDEVLVPRPGYPLFDFLTALDLLHIQTYALEYVEAQGWQLNFERLYAALGPRTRAIVVVSPHNPTGAYLKPAELAELNALCRERQLALIIDEVFLDYGSQKRPSTAAQTAAGNTGALTFVLSGLSKVAGLPQVKLGWIQMSGPDSLCAAARTRLEFIADTYLSVSASAQHAAPALLATRPSIQSQILSRLECNEAWLAAHCAQTRLLIREGGWYAVLEFTDSVSDVDRAQESLDADNVFVHPGYFYDFAREGYLVVSLLTPPEIFQAGLTRLLARWGK